MLLNFKGFQLKAYGVFEGGGVKGVALAGAYKAAIENNIEFVGLGGTSAGAIIALLAALDVNISAIEEMLVNKSFASFFENEGKDLNDTKEKILNNISTIFNARKRELFKVIKALKNLKEIHKSLPKYGISDGSELKIKLIQIISDRHPTFDENFTFDDLNSLINNDRNIKPLKIVASDLTSERGVVFSFDTTPRMRVLDAVRASTGYPFVFEPLIGDFEGVGSNVVLVDGGLSSNLPSFLFHSEVQKTHYPIFAFDIVESESQNSNVMSSLSSYLSSIISTAVTASDNLILGVIRGVYHIPVSIDDSIDTFDIDLSKDKRTIAFLTGYATCNKSLSNNQLIKLSKCIDDDVQYEMEIIYGSPILYNPILFNIKELMNVVLSEGGSDARISLYLPTPNDSLMSIYSSGFDEPPRHNFSFQETKVVCEAYLKNTYDWNDINSVGDRFVLAIPIETSGYEEENNENVIAVLCIDCKIDNIAKFNIFDEQGDLAENVYLALDVWIPILRKLIGPAYLN